MAETDLKTKTARTLKWNTFDKLATQLLYAVTGVVLANVLSKEDFGLVGTMLIFQAFANLFVDSGFSSALIQRKRPTQTDYSTIFYFNLLMSVCIYIILWFCAPIIAHTFSDERLIALSRVMFLSFIINATAIVQTNRLMKQMDVRMIAVSNFVGLLISGVVGIIMAVYGYGAWAIVWQTLINFSVRSIILWGTSKWIPSLTFSLSSLKSFAKVGTGVMTTSFLNTVFLYIYNYIIGAYYSLASLGVYTQADKWSKMGVMSLSQTLTASFLPLMSEVQDDYSRFKEMLSKTHRFTAYILFWSFGLLIVIAEPLFHLLFSTKWDEAIILFQLLSLRGIFTVLTLLYNNYLLSIGKAKLIVYSEIVKDASTIIAIIATISSRDVSVLVFGQVVAGISYFIFSLILTSYATRVPLLQYVRELSVYIVIAGISICPAICILQITAHPLWLLLSQLSSTTICYLLINKLLKSKIQQDVLHFAFGRFIKNT